MMISSPYSTSVLGKHGNDEIRLINLEPGILGSPVQASLVVKSLRSAGQLANDPLYHHYEAISYVWGAASQKSIIWLSGEPFEISSNLETALQRLRQPDKARTLWVDAICIDQHNVAERNSQVLLMDGIYRKSARVLIWLGPDDESFEAAAAFVECMRNNQHIEPCPPTSDHSCPNGLSSLTAILNKPWWERTWTLQEILLAREADVLCGNQQIPWVHLVQALTNVEDHYYGKRCCHDKARCVECRKQYFSFREHVGGLSEQQQTLKDGRAFGQGLNLYDILPQYRYRQATEPRDKVYAVLGMVHAEQSAQFDPDYLCSVEDLCTKTAVCNISNCGSLRSLNYASDRDPVGSGPSLDIPSWVTDWTSHSRDRGIKTFLQTRYEMYNAAKDAPWSGSFRGMGSEPYTNCLMYANGVLFDKVKHVGDLSAFDVLEQSYLIVRQWRALLTLHLDASEPYVGKGTIENAFWRTLTGDVVVSSTRDRHFWYERASKEHEREFQTWWEDVERGSKIDHHGSGMSAFLENITTAISRRRFFITERGYIANGPADTQPGDEVFILCGGKMPLVLRLESINTPQQSMTEAGPFHTLVGDSYVHGIMDGEESWNFFERSRALRLK
jgi:hypothetical protein